MKQNTLHTNKNTGFKVPNKYFNQLEDAVLSNLKLKEMAPTSGFKLPETYLGNLENNILKKVSTKKSNQVIFIFNRKNLVYISGVAAAILLLFNFYNFKNKSDLDHLDIETIENYILNENIGTYEIVALLLEEDLLNDSFTDLKIDAHTVETYILNNLDMEPLIIE